jgi:hypothetical protein
MLTACWQYNAFGNGAGGELPTARYLKILMGFYEERIEDLDALEKEGRLEGYVMTELEVCLLLLFSLCFSFANVESICWSSSCTLVGINEVN